MAKLPVIRRFSKEDTSDAPPWWSRVLVPLNSFVGSVYSALSNGLTFQDNFLGQIKTVAIKGASPSASFIWSYPATRPIGCIILSTTDTSATPAVVTNAVTVDWSYAKGSVLINNVSGLDPVKTYDIIFLVIGG